MPHGRRFKSPYLGTAAPHRLPEQQQAGVARLVAAAKIDCAFLAPDSWQLEGKRRIVGHGGCGARLIRDATCLDNDLLRESLALR